MKIIMNLLLLAIIVAVVYAEPPKPKRPFRPLPARFTSRFNGRQEAAPSSGYNYPTPEYGLPQEPEPQEPEPEFVTAEAEAGGDVANESDPSEQLRKALKKPARIVYIGLPEHQVYFDEIVYDSDFYPYTHSHYYEPYVSAVEVVSVPQPRLKSFSSSSVSRLF